MGRLTDLVEALGFKPFAALGEEESARVLAIRNEPEVRRNMYTDHEIAPAEHARWMARTIAGDDAEMFAVMFEERVVGAVGLTAIAPAHRRAEWAFYLTKDVQGKGLGSALEFKFLGWAFGERGLHKLNCEVLQFNAAVVALHRKFGFREEGLRREHIRRDGEWLDTVLLGMTAAEWSAQELALRQRLFK